MTAYCLSGVPMLTDTADNEGAGTSARGAAVVEVSVAASPAALRCVKVIALSSTPCWLL
jgi:hypothetical protein